MTNVHISIAIAFAVLATFITGCREEEEGGSQAPWGESTSEDPTSDDTTNEEPVVADPTSPDPTQDWCPSNTYVADLGGASGTASLAMEVGLNVIYVGGEITSDVAYYTFSGCELYRDIYTGMPTNNVCWVDVVDHSYNERFRAELHFYDFMGSRGFQLTANAYEGEYSTSYNFACQ